MPTNSTTNEPTSTPARSTENAVQVQLRIFHEKVLGPLFKIYKVDASDIINSSDPLKRLL